MTQDALDALKTGVTIAGVRYGPIEATLDREQGANVWLTFAIKEGKNREVRKVLEHLGLKVNRLIRLSYGPFELGELKEGAVGKSRRRSCARHWGRRSPKPRMRISRGRWRMNPPRHAALIRAEACCEGVTADHPSRRGEAAHLRMTVQKRARARYEKEIQRTQAPRRPFGRAAAVEAPLMIPKKPVPGLIQDGNRLSDQIMRKRKLPK